MSKPEVTKEDPKPLTKNEQTATDVSALLRARHTLLWLVTREEVRVERAITEAAAKAEYATVFWDCGSGVTDSTGKEIERNAQDPAAMLALVRTKKDRRVWVLRDLHKWLDPIVLRLVRNLARDLQSANRSEARAMVVITPSAEVPPELAGHATVIDWPLPERPEIASILDDVIRGVGSKIEGGPLTNGARDAAIDAAVGLTAEEAGNCYAKSLVTTRKIDAGVVSAEKKRVIAREKVLTWYDPDPRGFDAIGGLDLLKDWLRARRAAFSQRARAFGLPSPKGTLLIGIPGCGKSLTAKAIASAFELPLLRLDLGALKSKYVGESEGNIRKALSTAEAVAPCVLWLDEIEKALAGSTGPQGDGGVSADALGAVLSWMQERQGSVFVVATANDVRALPPELLRKGRFDELFFVDLPTEVERGQILAVALKQHGRDPSKMKLGKLAKFMVGFTGSEIAACVPDALFEAFADGEREVTVNDLGKAASGIVPLSKTAAEKINALREWAQGRARLASRPEVTDDTSAGRDLDL